MTKRLEVYKCEICGNIVEVIHIGKGQLVCCGKPMQLQNENTVEASFEKHIPVIEKIDQGIRVKVGSDVHPMVEKHYIDWIQVIAGDKAYRQFLKPTEAPEAVFSIDDMNVEARAYCNLHGLWKGK
ncbi:desulfoferrodoxin [Syntrophomonas erecta]